METIKKLLSPDTSRAEKVQIPYRMAKANLLIDIIVGVVFLWGYLAGVTGFQDVRLVLAIGGVTVLSCALLMFTRSMSQSTVQ